MHSPLSMQADAHLRDASGPSLPRRISRMPLITSLELVSAIPAGTTLGQASTHLPQRVHASTISSTRPPSAVSKEVSLIGCGSAISLSTWNHSPARPKQVCETAGLTVMQPGWKEPPAFDDKRRRCGQNARWAGCQAHTCRLTE